MKTFGVGQIAHFIEDVRLRINHSIRWRKIPGKEFAIIYFTPGQYLHSTTLGGTWIENNTYTIVGPRRKICLRRGEHLDDTLTEIQFPVEKVV